MTVPTAAGGASLADTAATWPTRCTPTTHATVAKTYQVRGAVHVLRPCVPWPAGCADYGLEGFPHPWAVVFARPLLRLAAATPSG